MPHGSVSPQNKSMPAHATSVRNAGPRSQSRSRSRSRSASRVSSRNSSRGRRRRRAETDASSPSYSSSRSSSRSYGTSDFSPGSYSSRSYSPASSGSSSPSSLSTRSHDGRRDRYTSRNRSRSVSSSGSYSRSYSRSRSRSRSKSPIYELGSWAERVDGDMKRPPWQPPKRKYDSCPTIMLHQEILDFVEYVRPTKSEHFARECIISSLEALLRKWDSRAELCVFGSFVTRLYLPESDIDATVWLPRFSSPNEVQHHMTSLSRIISESAEYEQMRLIRKARVPIIKMIHRELGIPIDISFQQTSGIKTVQTVARYLNTHKALKPLLFVLKMFFQYRNLNEVYTGGISAYSMIVMLMCFFNTHPLLLRKEIDPEQNLGVLLIEWFELFSVHFDINACAITVGGFTRKYHSYGQQNTGARYSIIDPNDRDNDLAIASRATYEIKSAIFYAYRALTTMIIDCERHSRRPKSLLSLLFRMHDVTVEHRIAYRIKTQQLSCKSDSDVSDDDLTSPKPKPGVGSRSRKRKKSTDTFDVSEDAGEKLMSAKRPRGASLSPQPKVPPVPNAANSIPLGYNGATVVEFRHSETAGSDKIKNQFDNSSAADDIDRCQKFTAEMLKSIDTADSGNSLSKYALNHGTDMHDYPGCQN